MCLSDEMSTLVISVKLFASLVALALVAGCVTDFGPPTATFNGTECAYSGLPEFTPGDIVTFTFKNTSDVESGLEIVKIVDGTSLGDLAAGGVDTYEDKTVTSGVGTAPPGESTSFEFRFNVDGDWLVTCVSDMDHPTTILRVSG